MRTKSAWLLMLLLPLVAGGCTRAMHQLNHHTQAGTPQGDREVGPNTQFTLYEEVQGKDADNNWVFVPAGQVTTVRPWLTGLRDVTGAAAQATGAVFPWVWLASPPTHKVEETGNYTGHFTGDFRVRGPWTGFGKKSGGGGSSGGNPPGGGGPNPGQGNPPGSGGGPNP